MVILSDIFKLVLCLLVSSLILLVTLPSCKVPIYQACVSALSLGWSRVGRMAVWISAGRSPRFRRFSISSKLISYYYHIKPLIYLFFVKYCHIVRKYCIVTALFVNVGEWTNNLRPRMMKILDFFKFQINE